MRKRFTASLLLFPALNAAGEAPLFQQDAVFRAALAAPVAQAYEHKLQEDRLYLEGSWSYKDAGETQRLGVKIRARGNYRRQVCKLPPLLLNFRKREVKGGLFDGQDKLKMVSPCGGADRYQQYVYLEHHVYQLYALFAPEHYRTRLVEVAYLDTGNALKPWGSVNFLIEDTRAMAARQGMALKEVTGALRSQMDLGRTALLELFQFLIGNEDYSTLRGPPGDKCCHNIRLLAPQGGESGFIPVPYDFDSAGIIDAPYATPPAGLPITDVSQRYFTGWCKEEARYREAIALLNAKRESAIALFADSPYLSASYRKKAVKYLERSYKLLNDDKFFRGKILGRCRGDVIRG